MPRNIGRETVGPAWLPIAAVGAVLLALGLYWFGGGFRHGFSLVAADWGAFGNYMSGVLTPIIILLLVTPILQAEFAAMRRYREGLKRDSVVYLSDIWRDIAFLMERQPQPGGTRIFGDYVYGNAGERAWELGARPLLHHLTTYVSAYAEALHVHETHFGGDFQSRYHRLRLDRLLSFLDDNVESLAPEDRVTLAGARFWFEGAEEE